MFEIPWTQISGAIAGGLVGGFSGFIANNFQERRKNRNEMRSVACALVGEISALYEHIEKSYLPRLSENYQGLDRSDIYPYYHFRGERDYMPVFRSLGSHVGILPSPLPRDLVSWYTHLAVCLERARDLHELAQGGNADRVGWAVGLAQIQHAGLSDLVRLGPPLVERLEQL
jgi:hypothetical protein